MSTGSSVRFIFIGKVGPLPTWGHPFGLLLEQLAVFSFSDGSIVHNQPYYLCDNQPITP